MGLQIIWNDITKVPADAVVTPASRVPRIGRGLDSVIHAAAGDELLVRRREMGAIGPGIVHVTPSYGLAKTTKARYIFHALGPVWSKKRASSVNMALDDTYLHILPKAVELKCDAISIPVLSSGKFGMPMGKALDAAAKAIQTFLKAFPGMTVKLVGIDSDFRDHAEKHHREFIVQTAFSEEAEARY